MDPTDINNFFNPISDQELYDFFLSETDPLESEIVSTFDICPPPVLQITEPRKKTYGPQNIFDCTDPGDYLEVLQNLIESGQIDANFNNGMTSLLIHAITINSTQAISYLLKNGANPNQTVNDIKPLSCALRLNNSLFTQLDSTINTLNLLFISGAKYYTKDDRGNVQLDDKISRCFPYKEKVIAPSGDVLFFLSNDIDTLGIAIIESKAFKIPIALKIKDSTFKIIKGVFTDSSLKLGRMKFGNFLENVDEYYLRLPWNAHDSLAIGLAMLDPDQLIKLIKDYGSKKNYKRILVKELTFVEKILEPGVKCIDEAIQWTKIHNVPLHDETLVKWNQARKQIETLKDKLPYQIDGFYSPMIPNKRSSSLIFDSITPFRFISKNRNHRFLELFTEISYPPGKWEHFANVYSLSKIFIRREGTEKEWKLFSAELFKWEEDKENFAIHLIPYALKNQAIKEKLIEKGLGYLAAQALLKQCGENNEDFLWNASLKTYIEDFKKVHSQSFSRLEGCLSIQNDRQLLEKIKDCNKEDLCIFSFECQTDLLTHALSRGYYHSALEILSRLPDEAISYKSLNYFLRPEPNLYNHLSADLKSNNSDAIAACKKLTERNVPKLLPNFQPANGPFQEKQLVQSKAVNHLPDEFHYLTSTYYPITISCFQNRQNSSWKLVMRSKSWTKSCMLELENREKQKFFEILNNLRINKKIFTPYLGRNNTIIEELSCLLTIESVCEKKQVHFLQLLALMQLKFEPNISMQKERHQEWLDFLSLLNKSDFYSYRSKHYFEKMESTLTKHNQKYDLENFRLKVRKFYSLTSANKTLKWSNILQAGTHNMLYLGNFSDKELSKIATIYSNYLKHLRANILENHEEVLECFKKNNGFIELPFESYKKISPDAKQHGMRVLLMNAVERDAMVMFGVSNTNNPNDNSFSGVFNHNSMVKNEVVYFLKENISHDLNHIILNESILFEISQSVIQQRLRYIKYRSSRFKKEIQRESSIQNPSYKLLPMFYAARDQDGIMILPMQVVLNKWNHPVFYLKDFNNEALNTLVKYSGQPMSKVDDLELDAPLYKIDQAQMKCLSSCIEDEKENLHFLLLKRSLLRPTWQQIADGIDFGDGASFGSFKTVKDILKSAFSKNAEDIERESEAFSLNSTNGNEAWGNDFYKSDSLNAAKAFLDKLNAYGFLFKKNAKLFPLETQKLNRLSPKRELRVPLSLKSYQQEGVQNISRLWEKGLNPILAFQMGLGKTITIAAALFEESITKDSSCHLIVTPKSLALQTTHALKYYLMQSQFNALCIYLKNKDADEDLLERIWNHFIIDPLRPINKTNEENKNKALALLHFHPFATKRTKFLERMFQDYNTIIAEAKKAASNFPKQQNQIVDTYTLKTLLEINPDDIVNLDECNDLPVSKGMHKFYVATYPMLTGRGWFPNILNTMSVDTVVFDEAQTLHTPGSQANQKTKNILTRLQSRNKNLRRLSSTGTPFENNYGELWELLTISNPEIFTDSAKASVNLFWQKAMMAYAKNKKPQDILFGFFHFESFRALIEKLVIVRNMNETQVKNDWNGRVPKVVRFDIDATKTFANTISQKALAAIQDTSDFAKSKGANLFVSNSKTERVLIHHSFKDIKIRSREAKSTISHFMKQITQTPGWLDKEIYHFPSASALCHLPQFKEAMQKGKRVLVFTSLIDAGALTKTIIEKKFETYCPEVMHFHGGLKGSNRNAMVSQFKAGNNKPKVLVLTLQAGGVGLDLPEGDMIVFLTPGSYNPGIETQAEARIARVNSIGTKVIVKVNFDTFMHAHTLLMRKLKSTWVQYLLKSHSQDSFALLNTFLAILREEKAHCQFLQDKELSSLNTPHSIEESVLKLWTASESSKETYRKILDRLHPLTSSPDDQIALEVIIPKTSNKRKKPVSLRGPLKKLMRPNPPQGQKRPPNTKIEPTKPKKIAKLSRINFSDMKVLENPTNSYHRSKAYYFYIPGESFAATLQAAKWVSKMMANQNYHVSFQAFLNVLDVHREARQALRQGNIPEQLILDEHRKWAEILINVENQNRATDVSPSDSISLHTMDNQTQQWKLVKYHKGNQQSPLHIGCTKAAGKYSFYIIKPRH